MKYVIVILDGAAGWPLAELGGRTTLQAAETPHLDALVCGGLLGKARTVPTGMEPSSSSACISILGYDPVANWVGRGAIEAAGMGLRLQADQVALRLNLVTIANGAMASYSSGSIGTDDSHAIVANLAAELDDDVFSLHPGVAYRHILVVTGHPELMECTFTPPHDISGKAVDGFLPKGPGVESLLDYMDRARPLLAQNQTNLHREHTGSLRVTDVWPFWPGTSPRQLAGFPALRGIRAAMTSGVDLLNGLAALFGIDRLSIAGVTGGSDNDYAAQAHGALEALDDHDLVVVHVEAPDEEGHAGDAAGKIAAIEAIDREVISRVRRYAAGHPATRILAMPDHPTPVGIKTHSAEPVPFVLWGQGIAADGRTSFDESSAEAGGRVIDPGCGVMDLLLAE